MHSDIISTGVDIGVSDQAALGLCKRIAVAKVPCPGKDLIIGCGMGGIFQHHRRLIAHFISVYLEPAHGALYDQGHDIGSILATETEAGEDETDTLFPSLEIR